LGFAFYLYAEALPMEQETILDQVAKKGADLRMLAEQLIKDSKPIATLVAALETEKNSKKFAYEKVLRFVSAKQPELIYPYFDFFCRLLDHENNFLKWGAIITIANLTAADTPKRFEVIFQKYFGPISGPAMITAANIIGSSVTITQAKPELADAIKREILKVEKAKFQIKGRPSPECRNIAIGHAIHALDAFYERIEDRADVLKFVKRQLKNTRPPVAKRAEQFIRKHE
jgi:hypothetical protein